MVHSAENGPKVQAVVSVHIHCTQDSECTCMWKCECPWATVTNFCKVFNFFFSDTNLTVTKSLFAFCNGSRAYFFETIYLNASCHTNAVPFKSVILTWHLWKLWCLMCLIMTDGLSLKCLPVMIVLHCSPGDDIMSCHCLLIWLAHSRS